MYSTVGKNGQCITLGIDNSNTNEAMTEWSC